MVTLSLEPFILQYERKNRKRQFLSMTDTREPLSIFYSQTAFS